MVHSTVRTSRDNLSISVKTNGAPWRKWYLLLADVHFDSVHCDRKLLKSLLEEAAERNAGVFSLGDWFDIMQLRDDKRRDKEELRREYVGSSTPYVDLLVEDSIEFRRPYQKLWVMDATGNHDKVAIKYAESNILQRVCISLDTHYMGYSGFVKWQFQRTKKGGRTSRDLFFEHGSGGGGVVTRGTLRPSRSIAKAQADIYVAGHIHEEWRMSWPVWRNTPAGKPYVADTLHLQIPPIKNENDLHGGFNTEKGRGPKPLGGLWLYFEHHPRARQYVHCDAVRAI